VYEWLGNLPDKRGGYLRVALAPALQQTQQITRAQLLNYNKNTIRKFKILNVK
jgi:hypothetical protein